MSNKKTSDYLEITVVPNTFLFDVAEPGITNFKFSMANLIAQVVSNVPQFLTDPLCAKDATYYYIGGNQSNGDWKINRYLISGVDTTDSATEAANPTYATLAAAFVDRATLTYS